MKQRLQMQISTHLSMTPQLRQAIHLLQLSSDELGQELIEALEQNPMLTDELPDEVEIKIDSYEPFNGFVKSSGQNIDYQSFISSPITLRDHLVEQLSLSTLSEFDINIGLELIDSISDDGYLMANCSDVAKNTDSSLDEVIAVLHAIQRFDPVGCGARDLSECLNLQLEYHNSEHKLLAKKIIDRHLGSLGNGAHAKLCRLLRVEQECLKGAMDLIQRLNPKPGLMIGSSQADYVIPDAYVYKQDGIWTVTLNTDHLPSLHINNLYADMVKKRSKTTDEHYLKDRLQEAKWLLKSVEHRNNTLYRVTKEIVRHQRDFLENGSTRLVPLTLATIAKECDLHESTISRVTTNKYLHTPIGTFELKYFFSSEIKQNETGCSALSIKAHIKKLIAIEDSKSPLSDSEIVRKLMQEYGISVARRTVAKYREAIRIPTSKVRRRV